MVIGMPIAASALRRKLERITKAHRLGCLQGNLGLLDSFFLEKGGFFMWDTFIVEVSCYLSFKFSSWWYGSFPPGSQLEELIQSFKSTEGPRLLRMLLVKLMCPHGRRYLIPQLICRRTWPFSGEFMGCCSDGSPSSFWPCVCSFTSTHSSLLFCFLFAQILPVNGKKYANILRNHLQS